MARSKKSEPKPINTNFQHHRAAMAMAAEMPRKDVAKEAGISDRTLERWLSFAWFRQMVDDYASQQRAKVLAQLEEQGITSRKFRIETLQRRMMQLGVEIDEAYSDIEESRDLQNKGTARVGEAILDRIKLEMSLARQGAQEAGQWQERINLSQLTDEQLTELFGMIPDDSDSDGEDESPGRSPEED